MGEKYYTVAFPLGERLLYSMFSGGGGGKFYGGTAIQHGLRPESTGYVNFDIAQNKKQIAIKMLKNK